MLTLLCSIRQRLSELNFVHNTDQNLRKRFSCRIRRAVGYWFSKLVLVSFEMRVHSIDFVTPFKLPGRDRSFVKCRSMFLYKHLLWTIKKKKVQVRYKLCGIHCLRRDEQVFVVLLTRLLFFTRELILKKWKHCRIIHFCILDAFRCIYLSKSLVEMVDQDTSRWFLHCQCLEHTFGSQEVEWLKYFLTLRFPLFVTVLLDSLNDTFHSTLCSFRSRPWVKLGSSGREHNCVLASLVIYELGVG